MKEAIRLTNKTAKALHKQALRVRRAYFCAAIVISLLLGAGAVVLGAMWLPAAPLMILLIALLDGLLMLSSRSRYLSMLAQAICTEASARDIRAGMSHMQRREQAIADLLRVKADVRQTAKKNRTEKKAPPEHRAPVQQEDAADENAAPRRRRQQKNLQIVRSEDEE